MAYTVTYKRRTQSGKMTTVKRRVEGNRPTPSPVSGASKSASKAAPKVGVRLKDFEGQFTKGSKKQIVAEIKRLQRKNIAESKRKWTPPKNGPVGYAADKPVGSDPYSPSPGTTIKPSIVAPKTRRLIPIFEDDTSKGRQRKKHVPGPRGPRLPRTSPGRIRFDPKVPLDPSQVEDVTNRRGLPKTKPATRLSYDLNWRSVREQKLGQRNNLTAKDFVALRKKFGDPEKRIINRFKNVLKRVPGTLYHTLIFYPEDKSLVNRGMAPGDITTSSIDGGAPRQADPRTGK